MKFLISLIALATLTTTPAWAFLSNQEENHLLKAMNETSLNKDLSFEDIRCSHRSRSCLVRFEIQRKQAGCLIERLQDASDLYVEVSDGRGHTQMLLSPYAEKTLAACVAGLL